VIKKSNRVLDIKEYYFSKKLKEIDSLKKQDKDIISFGIGSPDLMPANEVINAISDSILNEHSHKYQNYQGLTELRESISKFYNKFYGVELNPNNEILPLLGSKEGIMYISLAFLDLGDEVLIPNPSYLTYNSVTNLVGGKSVYYDLLEENNYEPDFEELEKKDLSKVKIMWVNYPHMPTGAPASKELFEKLVKFCIKHNILLVNDNPYSFILNDTPISILDVDGARDITIELNSLSKSFNMAGHRVGMVVGKSEFIDPILKIKSNVDSGMFCPVQMGAIAALSLDMPWFDNINLIYSKRRELVWKILDKLNCTYNNHFGGMFVWGKLPKGITSDSIVDDLLYNKNIFITPGHIFGSNGEGYVRFSLCLDEDRIKEALDRLD
jgi:LL-diaminopimelate aminotransferase